MRKPTQLCRLLDRKEKVMNHLRNNPALQGVIGLILATVGAAVALRQYLVGNRWEHLDYWLAVRIIALLLIVVAAKLLRSGKETMRIVAAFALVIGIYGMVGFYLGDLFRVTVVGHSVRHMPQHALLYDGLVALVVGLVLLVVTIAGIARLQKQMGHKSESSHGSSQSDSTHASRV
jgi:hypothetical protein